MAVSEILLFINPSRLHPLLVHLPIGIFYFAVFLYFLKWVRKTDQYDSTITIALGIALVSSILAATSGWFLAKEGGYDEAAIFWHKWLGIGTAVTVAILFGLSLKPGIQKTWSSLLYVVGFGLITVGGHFGGTMTHGEDYLVSSPADLAIAVSNVEESAVFEVIISPILQKRCVGCHNPSKEKGELLMTSPELIMAGGKTGAIIDLEVPRDSEMLRRLHLPLAEKKHMPPKGKAQLDDDEIRLIEWWLDNKACFDCLVSETKGADSVMHILKRYEQVSSDPRALAVDGLSESDLSELRSQGGRILTVSKDDPFISVSFANSKQISDDMIDAIDDVAENVIELDLGNTPIDDQSAAFIDELKHLEKLQLQNTKVGNDVLGYLEELNFLKSLNLYGTAMTDEAIPALLNLKALEKLYLWKTKMTTEGVAQLQKERPLLEISYAIDEEVFGSSKLNPTTIIAESDLFVDTIHVELESSFRGARAYYTLDGSDPDSTSTLYTEPIAVGESLQIKVISLKDGWAQSAVSSKQLVKTKHQLAKATLKNQPSGKYPGKGATSVIDLVTGSDDFQDGKWLGFEGTHFEAIMELEQQEEIENIFVSALSSPGSWIFYPQGVKVSVSKDGKNYKVVKEMKTNIDHREGLETKYFEVPFEKQEAKFLKVEIESMMKNPTWHPNPGGSSWLFIDEVLVN